MTKRILAIVMALVLSLSVLSFEAFAAFTVNISKNSAQNAITVSWGAVQGAARYTVTLNKSGGASTNQSTTSLSCTFSGLTGGTYTARVTAYTSANGFIEEATSSSISLDVTGTGASRKITVTGSGSTTTVTWPKQDGATGYYIGWTGRDSKNSGGYTYANQNSTTSHTINLAISDIASISVSYYNASGAMVPLDTWNNTGSSTTPGNTGSSGNVRIWQTTLSWGSYTGASAYRVVIYGQNQNVIYNNTYSNATTSLSLSNFIQQGYTYLYCEVYAIVNSSAETLIGYATYGYYSGSTGTAVSGIYVRINNYNSATVTWYDNTNGSGQYLVMVNGVSQYVYGSSATINYTYGVVTNIYVYRYNQGNVSGVGQLVGSAVIGANGSVSNSGGTGSSTTYGNTVSGYNCTLTVGSTSSTITWNPTSYNGYYTNYTVVYSVNGEDTSRYFTTTNTTANIPVGSSKSFSVNITAPNYATGRNEVIAYVSYTASVASNPTTSKVDGLTLTLKNSSTTTVSWDAVSGASTYQIEYARAGYSASETVYTSKTSVDIPVGKNVGFTVNVYAIIGTRLQTVGTATHKAGDDYPSSSSSGNNNSSTDNTPAFVTNLKGVATDKQVSLSWDAAKGNPGYDIYWKRESANEWKKAASNYSKRAVNIKGLINGTSYQFKVVANGRDSGILTITPQASGSTTRTAADPDGGASRVPVITSATGGSGTISVEWSGVTGGNLYKVYLSTDGRSYTRYAQVTGTSATINNLDAGKYWVRIKASTNNGSTWTELKDCKEATVTVK